MDEIFLSALSASGGKRARRVTGSREHIELSRKAASEGMGAAEESGRCAAFSERAETGCLWAKPCVDYVKGGGGSGDVTVAYTRNLMEGLKNQGAGRKGRSVSGLQPGTMKRRSGISMPGDTVPGMTLEPGSA